MEVEEYRTYIQYSQEEENENMDLEQLEVEALKLTPRARAKLAEKLR